ncbi:conserved protein of unknown function [Pseudodesulfovibrio profundus]|uniref:Uncharacterized protein n=1 Tax=Pseudodesulfovibrio profundus TaxID=57320 RepID=A0A2C8F8I8_9BACT|nr:hypothetical protein [Pseudodesulfovibrio profundus]SOB59072.1 conserved protein of unknown function [Pseudodesulfovibrio profundus]|tara:strand:+ start:2267 stop:2419 length:153 start_codon:yes stop_codon:yes gene_type:complete
MAKPNFKFAKRQKELAKKKKKEEKLKKKLARKEFGVEEASPEEADEDREE